MTNPLPTLQDWFHTRFGDPTPIQRRAWPVIVQGQNLLLAAPTGSGKTLAAFLPILQSLVETPAAGGVRCLYVAPLKALLSDVRCTLRRCIRDFRKLGLIPSDALRIGQRTGDTSARLRRATLRAPPLILLTTPESLALMLSQEAACTMLEAVRWVVVDEVHALAGSKRGADLALSLERLTALTTEPPQRIGLSATCQPLVEAARYLGGTGRPCAIVEQEERSTLELAIEPLDLASTAQPQSFLTKLVERLEPELIANRTTLIFANTRALAERVAWTLRRRFPEWAHLVAVHHSSLAAVRRRVVERGLKQGRLRAVVSSTSLELGIDIGTVDLVVLVHPPGRVVRMLQRVGRSGHGPGRVRRGLILTSSPAELCEAAVTCAAGQSAQHEPIRVADAPLDVLCQQLLGLAATRAWTPDEAFTLVRRAYPYRDLSRQDFEDCLDYLSGRKRDGTAWLPARLHWEGGEFTILDRRTARVLWRNIGTILDEDHRPVVQHAPGEEFQRTIRVGEVDHAFAEQLQAGDRFLLDGRCWEVRNTEGPDLLVQEVLGRPATPRWASGAQSLSPELAHRLYVLRVRAGEALRDGEVALAALLRDEYGLDGVAVPSLVAFFEEQERLSEIPDNTLLLVEVIDGPDATEIDVHTPLNHAGNEALVRVAVHRLARDLGKSATSLSADLGFALFLRGAARLNSDELLLLLRVENFEADLAAAIAESATLRERFRQTAHVGLMLLRNPLGRKRLVGGHDWVERRLFEQVRAADADFVLLRQARCEVLRDACDGPAALAFLAELPRRILRWRRLSRISPFVANWTQQTAGPAEAAESPRDALDRLQAQLTENAFDASGS